MSRRNVLQAVGAVRVDSDYIRLQGGMDQMTPTMQRATGTVRHGLNYEAAIKGGYARIAGYERFDGRPSPSAAVVLMLGVTITGALAAGDVVTGVTSSATGTVVAVQGTTTIALTKVTGTFTDGETLNVGGSPQATASITADSVTALQRAQYKNLAADEYRGDIAAVPGSGSILGVWMFGDVVYAFRNNAGGTAAAMYKSSASGWTLVAFEYEVAYTAGSGAAIADGGTLTQGGVTATIRRVLVRSGSLGAGTAVGTLVISVPAGGNFAAGAATVGAGTLTLSGAETAVTLLPDGRFEFVTETIGAERRMYGCDGVNRAFEFDGTYFVPITTGMTADTPAYPWVHKKHLFLSFGKSVQHSGIADPYAWTPVLGASEISVDDTVTGFKTLPGSEAGGALAIFTRNRTNVLYGSSSADWNLVPLDDELGAYAHTVQNAGPIVFLDDRGITDLQSSQNYGNFSYNALSFAIQTLVNAYRQLVTASCVSRDRGQYRLFFSNKQAFYMTLVGRKAIGIMQQIFADVVRCVCSLEKNDGSEAIYFGSDDGWVFQMDRGTSFDGDAIEAFITLPYNFQRQPRVDKRYRNALLEIDGSGYTAIEFGYELGYGTTELEQPASTPVTANFVEALWDAFTWDAFTWDGVTLSPSLLPLEGEAENISVAIRSNSDYFEPHTLTALIVNYTARKLKRA